MQTDLIKCFQEQAASTDFWVNEWNTRKDGASLKNALFALGKTAGLFSALQELHTPRGVPEDIVQRVMKNCALFNELMTLFVTVEKQD